MKSLNVIKNNFRSSEILNSSYSSKLKGGTDAAINNDGTCDPNSPIPTPPPTPPIVELIGEPWDKRTPRPGTKK